MADVRAMPDDADREAFGAYEDFLGELGYVACKLPKTSALPEALFQRVLRYNLLLTEGAALSALVALAGCGADIRPVVDSQAFKDWLAARPGDGKSDGFMAHLVRACLGIDRKAEMGKCLAQLGTYGVISDKIPYCFAFLGPWLTAPDLRAQIRAGLSSPDAGTRRGSLMLLYALGPDAGDMLPEMRGVLLDDNAQFRAWARESFRYVAGVDDAGRFVADSNPLYQAMLQESMKRDEH